MTVKAIGTYNFPAREPRANFDTDLLVLTYFEGNTFFVAPAYWRVPCDMPWGAFRESCLDPWVGLDPDLDLSTLGNWRVDGTPFEPTPEATLADLGIGWKSVVRFTHDTP